MTLTPRRLKELGDSGANVLALLRDMAGLEHNTPEIIEAAYELQTGEYTAMMADKKFAEYNAAYCSELARVIDDLGAPATILEAGVGEATTLSSLLKYLPVPISYGFDLSWSRVAQARRWLSSNHHHGVELCTGELEAIPFLDNSIDIVFTSHAIEPNGGREAHILRELYRVAREYVVLLEPGYELASDEARERMKRHGYCRGLPAEAERLGYTVWEHRLFPHSINPLNPTALTIIRKQADTPTLAGIPFACPRYRCPLEIVGGEYYSPEALAVYPTIGGIPCLRPGNVIMASGYPRMVV